MNVSDKDIILSNEHPIGICSPVNKNNIGKAEDNLKLPELPIKCDINELTKICDKLPNEIAQLVNNCETELTVEQKILLAPLRLQEAGFIMRPETPEDGNCFLWALLDQIR